MSPGHHQDAMNMTRALEALSPYLNHPRWTVIRIEVCVALGAALLFLQFILGSFRRRSGHSFVQGALWLAYTLFFPLIAYTLGQMVSSPVKNELYPLWAILLFWGAGYTNSITVYDIEDNKQWKRYIFELFQYYSYALFIVFGLPISFTRRRGLPDMRNKPVFPSLISLVPPFLVVVVTTASVFRTTAAMYATRYLTSKEVADYMSDQVHATGPRKILVCFSFFNHCKASRPTYRTRVTEHITITIDKNWSMTFDDSLPTTNGDGSPLKDVCLSYALSLLLKRRFFGLECAEATFPETREFVLKGLLPEGDEVSSYKRAFHIIEVELGFLYDFFFTKYAVLYSMEKSYLLFSVLKVISIFICGVFLLGDSFTITTVHPVIEVGTENVDVTITIVIMGILFLVEVLETILYLTSDWANVSLAVSYTRGGARKLIPSLIWFVRIFNNMISETKFGQFLDRVNLFGYWQNKMGQSSVIEDCLHVNPKSMGADPMNYIKDLYLSIRYSRKSFVVVPDLVKKELVSCLQIYCEKVGPLTKGEAALQSNNVFEQFSGILKNQSQTMIMLIWHIATEYCHIASSREGHRSGGKEEDSYKPAASSSEGHQSGGQEKEKVWIAATSLSRYCAYLMSFLPELLPDNSTDTTFINHAVLLEARELLPKGKPSKERLVEAIDNFKTRRNEEGNNNVEDPIFIKGLKLGMDLEEKIPDDITRWKVLTEFWAETIIYIAPSDNAKAHMERLAQGGEFLTHIWALLSHAGILKRDQAYAPEEMV